MLDRDIELIPPRGVACMKLRRWYIVVLFFVIPVQDYNGKKRLFCKFTWRTSLDMYVILQTGMTLFSPLVSICNGTKTPFDFELRKFWTYDVWVYSVSNNETFSVIEPGYGSCYKIKRISQAIIGWISLCHRHWFMAAWFIRVTIYLSQTKGTFPIYQLYKREYINEKRG